MKKTVFLGMTVGNTSVSDYFMTIAKSFVSHNYKVVIFSDKQQKNIVNIQGDIHILTWPSNRPTKLADAIFFYKQVKHYKPSVAIANFGSVNLMTFLGFILNIPIRVTWVHTLSTQLAKASAFKKWRKGFVYRLATQLITNSKTMKDDIIEYYNIEEQKVQVFPNALTIKNFENLRKKENAIIYVGRLHATKGVDVLIDAFSKVVEKNTRAKLEIIGSGEEEKSLLEQVKNLDLENNVLFLGSISKEDVLKKFQQASIAVVPSRSEAFGYVVIEAMSVKTAVIGSKVGGIDEIITDGEDGLLFESESSDALSSLILKLLASPEECEKLALKGYETVKDTYSNEKIAKNFVKYIINKGKK